MKLSYRGFDSTGKAVAGTIDANDSVEAIELLRKRGVFATGVGDESGEKSGSGGKTEKPRAVTGGGVKRKDVSLFMRELSVLVSSGTPVVDALSSLERQARAGAWLGVVRDVRTRVETGEQLSDALARHADVFDGVSRSLVAAGEQGGKLDTMLDRAAKLLRQQQKVRSSIGGAMVYPCVLLAVSMGVLATLICFVLPRFEGLFATLQTPLPPTTKVLMGLSHSLRDQWWAFLIGGGVAVTSLVLWLRSAPGKLAIDRLLVDMPLVGKITRNIITARIARVLGVLLEGRVLLVDALKLTKQSAGNALYADLVQRAEDAVTRGETLTSGLNPREDERALFAMTVCEAIRNGERSGRLGPVLVTLADHMDEDNEIVVRTIASVVEPFILVILGLVVGTVAVSMFLPLFDLTASGGGAR